MGVITDQLKFLGLNDKEVRVFTALSTFGRMNMTKISSRAKLSRTTVDAIVRRLVGQGLVVQEKVAGHFEYSVQLQEVADKLDWIEKRLRSGEGEDVSTERQGVDQKNDAPVDRIGEPSNLCDSCKSAMPTAQESATRAPAAETTRHSRSVNTCASSAGGVCTCVDCSCQGVVSTHDSMHSMIEQEFLAHEGERATMFLAALITPEKRMERLEHCFRHAREAKIHLEVLTTTDVSKALSLHAKEVLALLTAYDLRLFFLPPAFCIDATDLIAFRNVVIIVDHHANVAERVEGTRAVAVVNHLLRVAREVGWGMDMKMWLEGVLASQK